MSGPRPSPSLLAILSASEPLLRQVIHAAAADAARVLDVPLAPRLIRRGRGERALPAFPWSEALLYRNTYDPRRLFDRALAARRDPATSAVAVITDVLLDPPHSWRYLIFRAFGRRGALVSLAPLDPRFWSEPERERGRVLRYRLRATLVAALGPVVGLAPCDEPFCWLGRSFDGVDALDAMETLGPAHAPHPSVGKRFRRGRLRFAPEPFLRDPQPKLSPHAKAFERRPAQSLPLDLHWHPGPSASLDLFRLRRRGPGSLSLARRHSTPWAATIRPPIEEIEIADKTLRELRETLDCIIRGASFRGINVPRPPGPGQVSGPPIDALRKASGRLYDLVFPIGLERGLLRRGVFLDLGIDEGLLDLPFELMHDRDGFLALKHFVGRFVNPAGTRPGAHRGPLERSDPPSRKLRALVVGAGRARSFPAVVLDHAEAEAGAAAEALARLGAHVTELIGGAARVDAVYEALRLGPHLFHYSGHAARGAGAEGGRLLLADGDLDAASLGRALLSSSPAVAVLNACEAGRAPSLGGAARLMGLVDALLLSGSYAVAASWPVTDLAARAFSARFYAELLESSNPLGAAVRAAREAARLAVPEDDLTWAAYVLYGDPRLALRRP